MEDRRVSVVLVFFSVFLLFCAIYRHDILFEGEPIPQKLQGVFSSVWNETSFQKKPQGVCHSLWIGISQGLPTFLKKPVPQKPQGVFHSLWIGIARGFPTFLKKLQGVFSSLWNEFCTIVQTSFQKKPVPQKPRGFFHSLWIGIARGFPHFLKSLEGVTSFSKELLTSQLQSLWISWNKDAAYLVAVISVIFAVLTTILKIFVQICLIFEDVPTTPSLGHSQSQNDYEAKYGDEGYPQVAALFGEPTLLGVNADIRGYPFELHHCARFNQANYPGCNPSKHQKKCKSENNLLTTRGESHWMMSNTTHGMCPCNNDAVFYSELERSEMGSPFFVDLAIEKAAVTQAAYRGYLDSNNMKQKHQSVTPIQRFPDPLHQPTCSDESGCTCTTQGWMMQVEESSDYEWDNLGIPWKDCVCSSSPFARLHLVLDELDADLDKIARNMTEMEFLRESF